MREETPRETSHSTNRQHEYRYYISPKNKPPKQNKSIIHSNPFQRKEGSNASCSSISFFSSTVSRHLFHEMLNDQGYHLVSQSSPRIALNFFLSFCSQSEWRITCKLHHRHHTPSEVWKCGSVEGDRKREGRLCKKRKEKRKKEGTEIPIFESILFVRGPRTDHSGISFNFEFINFSSLFAFFQYDVLSLL